MLWEQLLAYTIRCLSDPRWELRRMGDQVLPLLTQVPIGVRDEEQLPLHI